MIKFQILSYPRTGSTMVNDILNRQSTIVTHGEIFHANVIAQNPENIIGTYGLHDRYYNINDFLNKFFLSIPSDCVGYKYILGTWNWNINKIKSSEFGFPEELINDRSIKRIVMYRKDLLRTVVSYQIASRNNEWVISNGKAPIDINYEISVDNTNAHIKFFEEKYNAWIKFFKDQRHDIYNLAYEDISLKTINGILNYLEQPNTDSIYTSLAKINNEDRYNQILNKDELNREFSNYGKL